MTSLRTVVADERLPIVARYIPIDIFIWGHWLGGVRLLAAGCYRLHVAVAIGSGGHQAGGDGAGIAVDAFVR